MHPLLPPALPFIVLMLALLCRQGALRGAALGCATAIAVIALHNDYALHWTHIAQIDAPSVAIVTLSAALVIVPGQIFNAALRDSGTIFDIGARIAGLRLTRAKIAAIIALGIAPTIESMTGFGVSLFFSVPVFLRLFAPRRALLLALLSMNIMPWGTLGFATILGAQIAAQPMQAMAQLTAAISAAVFPLVGVLVFIVCRMRGGGDNDSADNNDNNRNAIKTFREFLYPLSLGILLSATLIFYNAITTAEIAGVCAGITVTAIALLAETLRGKRAGVMRAIANKVTRTFTRTSAHTFTNAFTRATANKVARTFTRAFTRTPAFTRTAANKATHTTAQPLADTPAQTQRPTNPPRLAPFIPYLALLAAVAATRIPPIYQTLQNLITIERAGLQWFVLTSPGICILLALLIAAAHQKHRLQPRAISEGIRRALYPLGGIFLFGIFAQLHKTSGIFADFTARLIQLDSAQTAQIIFIAPLLAMLSGWLTGSNVGGNVLLMTLQTETGAHFGNPQLFAALQNSGAGHSVFISLPIILLTLSIASAHNPKLDTPQQRRNQQAYLVRRTLYCAPLIYLAITAAFYFQLG